MTCNPNQVRLTQGDNGLFITPIRAAPTTGADGSLTMNVMCDVRNTPGAGTILNVGYFEAFINKLFSSSTMVLEALWIRRLA